MRTGDNLRKRYTAATPMQLDIPVHCQDTFAICRGFELLQAPGWQERAKVEAFLAGRQASSGALKADFTSYLGY